MNNMKNSEFTEQLSQILSDHVPRVQRSKLKQSRRQLMHNVKDVQKTYLEQAMIRALSKYYKPADNESRQRIKFAVQLSTKEKAQSTWFDGFIYLLGAFSRKALATGFAIVLLYAALLLPLNLNQSGDFLSEVKAVHLNCFGQVYLNGILCDSGDLVLIKPGDLIETDEHALATIIYDNHTVVRLDEDSELRLSDNDLEQIFLAEGSAWLNSPLDSGYNAVKIATSVMNARLPQGAFGITTRRNVTQLVTTTAAVELQISKQGGATELITIAPEKSVTIRKNIKNTRVNPSLVNSQDQPWVDDNLVRDEEHLDVVKGDTVDDGLATAGVLPGSVGDYVKKVANSAKTALTWDQDLKLHRQLLELDELFAEVIVLLENGDKVTADTTLLEYGHKFSAIVLEHAAQVSKKDFAYEEFPLVRLLQKHIRLVSIFSIDDPQYVLRAEVQALSLHLEANLKNSSSMRIVSELSRQKVAEAHRNLLEGNLELAAANLRDVIQIETSVVVTSSGDIDTGDLVVLNEIAAKSSTLKPIVRQIMEMRVEKLRLLSSQSETKEVVSSSISGEAYRLAEDSEINSADDDDTVKIVGQAVREEI